MFLLLMLAKSLDRRLVHKPIKKGGGAREGRRRRRWRKEVIHLEWICIACSLNFISSHVLHNFLQELREEVKSLMQTRLQTVLMEGGREREREREERERERERDGGGRGGREGGEGGRMGEKERRGRMWTIP